MAKKKEQQVPQEVAEALNQSEAFFLKYKKTIITIVAAIVLIVVGWMLAKQYIIEPKEAEASTVLAKGQEYMLAEQYDKALKGDGAGFKGFLAVANDL